MSIAQTTTHPWTIPLLPELDATLRLALRAAVDGKAKPPGSLGRLEDLAIQIGLIQGRRTPRVGPSVVLVFAGDHGLNAEGVSAYPSAITAAMVGMFLSGRATVSAFAAAADVQVEVIDAGVDADLTDAKGLTHAKIGRGTANAAREPAMTPTACAAALDRGLAIAKAAARNGADVIALGEMGIGNTASASLLLHRLGPAPLEACIGAGAGHNPEGLARKTEALRLAAARTDASTPFEVLCEFGGYEIAMMAGAALGAAAERRPVVVDGFIASAAVLAAIRLQPTLAEFCIFAHCSAERAHRLMLERLGAEPLLDLRLRLGEGTGAVLAIPLLRAAARLITDVADLTEVLGQG
ncbi:MAG: nicotinate-nucleotide--dimethylbenzimidazole phosphoribosyltransferase [Steroidobacteraceae bacterium]